MGTWNGGWGISMAVPQVRLKERQCLELGYKLAHNRPQIWSHTPPQFLSLQIVSHHMNCRHKSGGNGACICWFDYQPTNQPTPPLYQTDHRGQLFLLWGHFSPSKPSSSKVRSTKRKPSGLCARHMNWAHWNYWNFYPFLARRHLFLESVGRSYKRQITFRITFLSCLILVYTWLFMQWRFERGLVFILRKQFGDNHEKKLNHSWSILITILRNRPTVFEIYGLASGSTWQ